MKPRDSCEPMYSALGIMRFSDVNVYLSKYMFRVCKGDVPEIFRTYFRLNSEIHKNHFTRQCDYLHVPIVKSNLGKSNIRYRGYSFDVSTHLSFDSIVIQHVLVFVMTCPYYTYCVRTVLTILIYTFIVTSCGLFCWWGWLGIRNWRSAHWLSVGIWSVAGWPP